MRARGGGGTGVCIADSLLEECRALQKRVVHNDPRDICLIRIGGLHAGVHDQVVLVVVAGLDSAPRESSGVHGGVEAGLALGHVAVFLFHAQDEGPGSHGGVSGLDGVDVPGELVLHAQLQRVGLALAKAVLTGEGSVSVLLGVAVSDQLQGNDLGHIGLRQHVLEGAGGEALAPGSLGLVVQHNGDERVVSTHGEGAASGEESSLEHGNK
jgi:hypothetical protein